STVHTCRLLTSASVVLLVAPRVAPAPSVTLAPLRRSCSRFPEAPSGHQPAADHQRTAHRRHGTEEARRTRHQEVEAAAEDDRACEPGRRCARRTAAEVTEHPEAHEAETRVALVANRGLERL